MRGPLAKFAATLSICEGTLSLVGENGVPLEIEAACLRMAATNVLVA